MPYSVFSLKVFRNRNLKSAFCSIEFGYVKEKFHLKISAKAKNSKKIVDSGGLSDKSIQLNPKQVAEGGGRLAPRFSFLS